MTSSNRTFITAERDLLFHFKSIGRDIAAQHLLASHCRFFARRAGVLGTNRFPPRCAVMAKTSKTGKAVIPEPSFEFFLGAIGVMILLVIATAVYFSIHT
jgi:hypothetical protein